MPILVVEDEALLLMMLCEEFEHAGLEVVAASSAQQALDLLRVHCDTGIPVLVTDLNLGPGIDGVALAETVRRRCPDIVVIYATGNAGWLAEQPTAFRPGDRLFSKPYNLAGLIGAVQAAVQSPGSAPSRPVPVGARPSGD